MLLPFLLLLSFGSGVAALIYEVVWFQILELVIGSSAVSLAVLLATFMGGTCLGSLTLPRLVSDRHSPLRVYAAIEVGIACFGILVLLLAPSIGAVYTAWSGYGLGNFMLRGIVAAICLLPPTFLMGATLPTLSRTVEPTTHGISWLGLFYGSNIAGAVFGCLISGFYLLRHYDVTTATNVAAAVNAGVATIALVLPSPTGRGQTDEGGRVREGQHTFLIYVAIALSGLCAMAAEVIWTRTLGLLFGASVYTLSIILAVFLTGLGIGSSLGSLLSRNLTRPRAALGWCQLLTAAAIAWSAYTAGASLPYWPINPSLSSNIWFNFQLDLARACWVLLVPTLLWGASFPFALAAAVSKQRKDTGQLVAGVYAANTAGAIVGATSASLFLISWIGSQRAEQLLIAISAATGLILIRPQKRWAAAALGIIAVCATGALIRTVPSVSQLLVAYGRYAATWAGKSEIVYGREGLNSSVAVSQFPNGVRTFHVAGKIQASNVPRDMRLQRMLGHLTTLTPVRASSVLVIGCGAGVTAGAVSVDPGVERVTIVEIEPAVPQTASRYFGKENFDVLSNSKVQVRIDDGRHYLFTTKEQFDGITADPLDPWVKGATNLYTKEFFESVKRRLRPGGVVTVYIQLFETNLEAVRSSLATFFEVFPNGTVWGNTYESRGHDMILLGQVEPLRVDVDEMEHRLASAEYARVMQSLEEVGMHSAIDLFATYAGRGSDLSEWLKNAAINRDRNLRMQYLAGLGLNLDDSAAIYADMLTYRRFPADIFTGSIERLDALRDAIGMEAELSTQ
ncbi:MAG: SAM-dependent methyltransferase [Proteobacteria bacterium]|nr:MAG: SAM-dependent methyltransferase [Pseudomonadota bacterium]